MDYERIKQNFISNLELLIKKARITQERLCADLSDVSGDYRVSMNPQMLSKLKGNSTMPKLEFVLAVSKYFNVSIDELLGNKIETTPDNLSFADMINMVITFIERGGLSIHKETVTYKPLQNVQNAYNTLNPHIKVKDNTEKKEKEVVALYVDPAMLDSEDIGCDAHNKYHGYDKFLNTLFAMVEARDKMNNKVGNTLFNSWVRDIEHKAKNYDINLIPYSLDDIQDFDERLDFLHDSFVSLNGERTPEIEAAYRITKTDEFKDAPPHIRYEQPISEL